eukprot:866296_1
MIASRLQPIPLLSFIFAITSAALIEHERVEEYERRGHTWPPRAEDYTPNTQGWRSISERRFKQVAYADSSPGEKYQGYLLATHSGLTMKNFTEYGWAVTRAPQAIIDKLKKRLHHGLAEENSKRREKAIACVETTDKYRPYFFDDYTMNKEILHEMLPLHEAWAGVELVPNNSYGLRVYRNETNLNMHLDKSSTHIISSILHVDHGKDDEPWPIVIEDFHGNTNEVYLESGDMLFYESSKCFHGRPAQMNGEYYSSLFTHYYPKEWNANEVELDVHYRIPHHWAEVVPRPEGEVYVEELDLVETSVKEHECPDAWCGLKSTKKWHGPAPGYGKILSGGGMDKIEMLENIPTEDSFEKYEHQHLKLKVEPGPES